jgi:hypothetical protein
MTPEQVFGALPEARRHFGINALVAQYGKLSVDMSQVKQYSVLSLCLVHTQSGKHLNSTLHWISTRTIWLDMHPDFARCGFLSLPDGIYKALLLVGCEGRHSQIRMS